MSVEQEYQAVLKRIEDAEMEYRPSQQDKLKMYAWFKQINEGDVSGEKPGMANFVGRAKYMAWERCKGLSQEEAMQAYIDFFKDKV